MLYLFQSNKLEHLYEMLATVFQHHHLSNPFQPEIVVVQSKGMGRWINFKLAQSKGIAANIEYPLPASFFWKLLNQLLGEQRRRSAFSPEVLTFRILRWLEEHPSSALPLLKNYLAEGGDFRRYELAHRLADIFDQYLVYRPDWLLAWEKDQPAYKYARQLLADPDELWQAQLWRDLVKDSEHEHRAHTLAELLKLLERGQAVHKLPQRVSLVGITALPPVYMNILKALSNHIDVLFFALNPCEVPWGDIRDESEQGRLAQDQDPADLYLNVGHTLLARWGKQGRDFFDALSSEATLNSVFDDAVEPQSLLQWIQYDILTLTHRGSEEAIAIAPEDRSLQLHICHTAMREVEVLHDQLLILFNQHPELKPSDIVVLTPDIETYAPLIEAIFEPHPSKPAIPYSIADRTYGQSSSLVQVFLRLLELSHSRFEANTLLEFLDVEAIRYRFSIEEKELPLIRHWIQETHIRWGKNADHKTILGLPANDLHTWQEGLRRLLVGIALPHAVAETQLPLYEGILPFDDIEGSAVYTAAKLSRYIEVVFEKAEQLTASYSVADWSHILLQWVEDLLEPQSEDDQAVMQTLRESIQTLGELGLEANYRTPVDSSVIRSWFGKFLESKGGEGGFLTGGVTFCTIVPMRSLPFKVVCLIGMNEGAFPRKQSPQPLDLIARYPRKGDRSRRADDRFLLLETLLSARETFYISYIGKDIRTDAEIPSSILISDLLDIVQTGFILKGAEEINALFEHVRTFHPLQPFDARYFSSKKWIGFSQGWCKAAQQAGQERVSVPSGYHQPLPPVKEFSRRLEVKELLAALIHPTRHLLRQRCGLNEPRWSSALSNTEPFNLDYKEKIALRSMTWMLLNKGFSEHALEMVKATGWLPHGKWGERLGEKEYHIVHRLYQQTLSMEGYGEPLPDESWHLVCKDGITLTGWLKNLRAGGIVIVQPQSFSPYQLLTHWINHLALCWMDPEGKRSRTLLIDEKEVHYFKRCAEPEKILQDLVTIYQNSLCEVLPLFRKSSSKFAEALAKSFKEEEAKLDENEEAFQQALKSAEQAAQQSWNGPWMEGQRLPGEWEEDIWLERVWARVDPFSDQFQERFYDLAKRVWLPLYKHLETEK